MRFSNLHILTRKKRACDSYQLSQAQNRKTHTTYFLAIYVKEKVRKIEKTREKASIGKLLSLFVPFPSESCDFARLFLFEIWERREKTA